MTGMLLQIIDSTWKSNKYTLIACPSESQRILAV